MATMAKSGSMLLHMAKDVLIDNIWVLFVCLFVVNLVNFSGFWWFLLLLFLIGFVFLRYFFCFIYLLLFKLFFLVIVPCCISAII